MKIEFINELVRERIDLKSRILNARAPVLPLLRFVSLVAITLAILSSGATAAQWSTTDLKTSAPLPAGTATVNGVSVQWQVGNYLSGNLQIYGILCAPTAAGPHPVAILNHGLHYNPKPAPHVDPAILPYSLDGCRQMAAKGWLAAMSTYRGEAISVSNFTATSDGIVELCYGEVDDVLNLLSAVTALPGADAQKILMLGYSHGSCITERAIERGAQVQIAVSIDGPTDFMTWPDSPPALTPQEREARSSVNLANNPAALTHLKFLRIQAAGDTTVPPAQGCELAARIGTTNFLFDSSKNPPKLISPSPPPFGQHRKDVCSLLKWVRPGLLLPWPRPETRLHPPLMYMYTGLNHILIGVVAWPQYAAFVNRFAIGWSASMPAAFAPFG